MATVIRFAASNSCFLHLRVNRQWRRGIMGGANNVNGSATTSSTLSPEDREALKMRTLEVSRVIVNTRECHQVVDEMLRAGQPVGLDGEGVNLGPKGN